MAAGFARRSLMAEIQTGLQTLCDAGTSTVIDLKTQPFSAIEIADVQADLGTGEVTATLEAMGRSTVSETALPGVWLVEHRDAAGRLQTQQIEITTIPEILCAQRPDVLRGLGGLTRMPDAATTQENMHVRAIDWATDRPPDLGGGS